MKALLLEKPGTPLKIAEVPVPDPGQNEVLLKVICCGLCRTDLHIIDGELEKPVLPLIPGHQIVGIVVKTGAGAARFKHGDRVGVPWLGKTCGKCVFCREGRENLCDNAVFTGYTRNGGFAEFAVADEQFCFRIPKDYPDLQAAPLLCAGLIGYRAYRFAGEAKSIGLYGFGSAAHIICQVAVFEKRKVFAFTRPGDMEGRKFALSLGVCWAGDSDTPPPEHLDAAIIFAPAGPLVPLALRAIRPGGKVICAGIHMSPIPSFPYEILWGERSVQSVANLTRLDGEEFLELAPKIPVHSEVRQYPMAEFDRAISDLRDGNLNGSAVITVVE